MKKFKFKKIDAFATEKSDGNPAGYIWLNSHSDIDDKEMLQIAKELKADELLKSPFIRFCVIPAKAGIP